MTVSAERRTLAVVRVRDNGIGASRRTSSRRYSICSRRAIARSTARKVASVSGSPWFVGSWSSTAAPSPRKRPGVGAGAELHPAICGERARRSARDGRIGGGGRRSRRACRRAMVIVEDNPDVADSLVMILELHGHHVRLVNDGPSALEAARSNVPDVMLIDIGLPGMNGYEVARSLETEPALKHVVLVALTGYGRADDKAKAMAAGFDHHPSEAARPRRAEGYRRTPRSAPDGLHRDLSGHAPTVRDRREPGESPRNRAVSARYAREVALRRVGS